MGVVLFEKRGRVALVTLNRPESLNAFDADLRDGLLRNLQAAAADDSVRAVVVTGAGRAFSAGADLKATVSVAGSEVERMINDEYGASLREIARMPKPVIAAVGGLMSGIGAAFALVCDLVVMGESAYFQVPFLKIGLVPDGGLNWLLTERVGPRRAFELAVSGERVPARQCLEWNLVNRVVPDAEVVGAAVAWGEQLGDVAPIALRYTKQLLRSMPALGYEEAIRAEAKLQAPCIDSQDFQEGVAAFREKRPAKFSGR